ncbi:HET-domain-containing protein [Lophiostoma macrostomum CBS 122681]|uniref:HET-domain-containing protein n=1 Tax=Lophiostoma macrostomum CBS 122681 TaxID=1314788 RepID=A0A6A6TKW5_9PLEO|nr:HET-domain-containing protein [Lophiostoma macrostomum CBS 122681]
MDTLAEEALSVKYTYSPLPTADSFRILELHPGTHEAPLKVSLRVTTHRESPVYEALSYVWGDSGLKRSISCGGKILDVTDNLYEALLGLRSPVQAKIMWIDAICICQEDLAERSQQVAIMGSIYARAAKTKVWLGPENPASVRGLGLIKYIAEECCIQGISIESNDPYKGLSVLSKNIEPITKKVNARLQESQHPWADIEAVVASAWFKRLWIIQEVGLSVRVDAHFGSHHIPWPSLVLFSYWYGRAPQALLHLRPPQDPVVWYDPLRPQDLLRCRVEVDIANLLNLTRTSQCSDPRDKIYGLLAMPAFRRLEPAITADYTLSVREVYTLASARAMEELNDLDMLTYGGNANDAAWPSWVPSWTRSSNWRPVCYENVWRMRATRTAQLTSQVPASVNRDTNTLQVTGCLLGTAWVVPPKDNAWRLNFIHPRELRTSYLKATRRPLYAFGTVLHVRLYAW